MYDVVKNEDLKIHKCKMNCDEPLGDDIPSVLPRHHFCALICGAAGSGKTSLLNSLMGSRKYRGKRQSYKGVFDHVIICSPSLKSLSNNIYEDLEDHKKHEEFNMEFIDFLTEFTGISSDDKENTICILDDVGSSLKKSKQIQEQLAYLIMNRRHRRLSFFILVQYFKNVPLPVRTNVSHLFLFKPSNKREMDNVWEELMAIPKSELLNFASFVWDKKHSFLYVDLSLKHSNSFIFYKQFDKIIF